MDRLITITELAALFQISRSTAYRMKKEQRWPHVRFGTEIRFTAEDVAAIQQMNHQAPPPQKIVPKVGTRANRNKQ